MLDQSSFAIPVRILKDSSVPAWVQLLAFTLLGFVLGLVAEPIKQWLSRRSELRLAKREIYDDLASYIADLHITIGNGPTTTDQATYKRVRRTPPKMDVVEWYTRNRFDLLLWLDKDKGIRLLYEKIKTVSADTDERGMIKDQQSVLTFLEQNPDLLDQRYLRDRIAACSHPR